MLLSIERVRPLAEAGLSRTMRPSEYDAEIDGLVVAPAAVDL